MPKKLLHGIILTVTNSNSKGENMHYTAILDIGSSKVTCIICSKGGSDMPVVMHGVGMCEYSGYRTGDFIESNLPDEKSLETAVKRVIAQAENEAGVKLKSVIVGVDVPFLNSILMQGKLVSKNKRFKVSESDDDKLLKLSLKDVSCTGYTLCHCAPICYYADGAESVSLPVGSSVFELAADFSHIFVSNDYVELVNDVLARRGLYANSYVAVPLAEIYTLIPPHASSKGALLIDMGYSHTDLTFVKNSMIVDMKVIHAGGKHFSNDLSKVLQIPLNVAENLKRRFVLGLDYDNGTECIPASEGETQYVKQSYIAEIIEARAEEFGDFIREYALEKGVIHEEYAPEGSKESTNDSIDNTIDKHYYNNNTVYLTGGGIAMMQGGVDFLEKHLGITINASLPAMPFLKTPNYVSAYSVACFALYSDEIDTDCTSGKGIGSLIKEFFGVRR